MTYCVKCGEKLNKGVLYCTNCGYEINKNAGDHSNGIQLDVKTDSNQALRKKNLKNIRNIIVGVILIIAGMVMLSSLPSLKNNARKYDNQYRAMNAIGVNSGALKSTADKLNGEVSMTQIGGGICIAAGAVSLVLGIRRKTKSYVKGE